MTPMLMFALNGMYKSCYEPALDAPALPLKNYSTFIACTAVWSICTDGPMVEAMYMLFQ